MEKELTLVNCNFARCVSGGCQSPETFCVLRVSDQTGCCRHRKIGGGAVRPNHGVRNLSNNRAPHPASVRIGFTVLSASYSFPLPSSRRISRQCRRSSSERYWYARPTSGVANRAA